MSKLKFPCQGEQLTLDAAKPSDSDTISITVGRFWQKLYCYKSHGSIYYRYVYGEASRTIAIAHVPGGSIFNPVAQGRAREIKNWMLFGVQPPFIHDRIKAWSLRQSRVPAKTQSPNPPPIE